MVARTEYPTEEYYIDGELAYLIAHIEETLELPTFRKASLKVANMLQNSPLRVVFLNDVENLSAVERQQIGEVLVETLPANRIRRLQSR